jgi:hypothetical protein
MVQDAIAIPKHSGVPPKNTTKPDAKSDLRLAKDLFFCHNTNIIT